MKYIKRKDKKIYLAGAMEYASDKGKPWRKRVARTLKDKGYQVYDPTQDEDVILDTYEFDTIEDFHNAKKSDNPHLNLKFVDCMTGVVRQDLEQVNDSDLILVYIDETLCTRPSGTIGEVTLAHWNGQSIVGLLADEIKFNEVPGWLQGCIKNWAKTPIAAYRLIDEIILKEEEKVNKGNEVRFREEPGRSSALRSTPRNRKNTYIRSKKVLSR